MLHLFRLCWKQIAHVHCAEVVINEINFIDQDPYIELTRSIDVPHPDENLGPYGLSIFEYQRFIRHTNRRDMDSLRLRTVIDLTGSNWPAADKYFLIGHSNHNSHIQTDQWNQRIHHMGRINYDWLETPKGTFLFVILTYSPDVPISRKDLWGFMLGQKKHIHLRGDMLDYIMVHKIDGVVLAGKDHPATCKRFNEFREAFMGNKKDKKFVPAPMTSALKLSANRCGTPDLLEKPAFTINHFVLDIQSPRRRNPCESADINLANLVKNPKNLKPNRHVKKPDICRADDSDDVPMMDVRDEAVNEAIQKNHNDPGSCPPPDRIAQNMAETNNNLRKMDVEREKLDKAHALRKQFDDEWEIPNHGQFDVWKSIIEDFQDDLIDARLMTKPHIQEFIEYLPNQQNLGLSRVR